MTFAARGTCSTLAALALARLLASPILAAVAFASASTRALVLEGHEAESHSRTCAW